MENEVIEQPNTEVTPPVEPVVEQPAEKPKNEVPEWALKRFGELTAARKEAERKAAEVAAERDNLRKQLETGAPPDKTVEELARSYAETLAPQIAERARRQEKLSTSIERINADGRQEFGAEFDRAISNLGAAGIGGDEFVNVISEVPNAAKVVQYLGTNLEEAHRLASLSPVQMAVELVKLAPKAEKAFAKPISSAPAPIEPLDGRVSASGEPKVGTDEWFTWRNANARKRRR